MRHDDKKESNKGCFSERAMTCPQCHTTYAVGRNEDPFCHKCEMTLKEDVDQPDYPMNEDLKLMGQE